MPLFPRYIRGFSFSCFLCIMVSRCMTICIAHICFSYNESFYWKGTDHGFVSLCLYASAARESDSRHCIPQTSFFSPFRLSGIDWRMRLIGGQFVFSSAARADAAFLCQRHAASYIWKIRHFPLSSSRFVRWRAARYAPS